MNKELPGCIWEPDDRDFKVEDILGSEDYSNLPESFVMEIEENNQGALKETAYACTCYSTYNALQASIEFARRINVELDALRGFRKQKEYGTFREGFGDELRTAFKAVIDSGVYKEDGETLGVAGYALLGYGHLIDPDRIRFYLSKGLGLVTSFDIRKNLDYKTSGYLKLTQESIVGGHAVAIIGYENGYFILANSYSDRWGRWRNGTFRVKEEDLNVLKGIYVLYPKPQVNMLYKDISEQSPHYDEIKLCKDLEIMTGYDNGTFQPDVPITRREVAIVAARLYKKLSNPS